VRIEFTHARTADPSTVPGPSVPAYIIGASITAFGVVSLFAGVGGGIAIGLFGAAVIAAAWQRQRSAGIAPTPVERRWLLTDEGIEVSTALTEARSAWTAFGAAAIHPTAYVLTMRDRADTRAFDIPRGPLDEQDDEALRAAFARHDIRRGLR
jgi:hypothetical protein